MTERDDVPVCADAEPAGDDHLAVPVADDEPAGFAPARVGCRTDLRGWAGAHAHGAVRPQRRASRRGRPPGRWC